MVVGVGRNTSKSGLFSLDERLSMLTQACTHLPNVVVAPIDGLLAEYCRVHGVGAFVKGLRFASDFDYELQMAQMNGNLTGVDTVFIPTSPEYMFIASSLVKEVAKHAGDVGPLVPAAVLKALDEKYGHLQ